MIGPLLTVSLPLPPADIREILRYAGAKAAEESLLTLLDRTLEEAQSVLAPKICFRRVPVRLQEDTIDLGFARVRSGSAAKVLTGCDEAIVFAATLGIGLDRLIARYGMTAPAKGLLLQAIGTERIEALCDTFCQSLREQAAAEHLCTTRRFSPGYGNLPLEFQRKIFQLLDCQRSIGLTLNGSLLMSPSKSVTAIVGLGPDCSQPEQDGCAFCEKTDCIHRRSL